MEVRTKRRPVGATVAVPVLLLVLLGEGEGCGCWGTNQVYVHYKAPVTGWYNLAHNAAFTYERLLRLKNKEEIHYILEYKADNEYWILVEKKQDSERVILSNSIYTDNSKKIIVSCPRYCSCESISVMGLTCQQINGEYSKSKFTLPSTTRTHQAPSPPQTSIEESRCFLAKLTACINGTQGSHLQAHDVCQNYTNSSLSSIQKNENGITPPPTPENYTCNDYTLKKANEKEFWMIVSRGTVFAVSLGSGPCPDQLSPDKGWVLTNNGLLNKPVDVTCTAWDNPSGD